MRILLAAAVFSFTTASFAQKTTLGGVVGDVVNTVKGNTSTSSTSAGTSSSGVNFTQSQAADAIKEALLKGVTTGISKVAVQNGYFGNALIKIPFPKEAQVIQNTLNSIGAKSLTDKFVLQMNRAAESAAKEAGPIFMNSIKQMTINDAINIVSNQQQDAATQFLKRTTTTQLTAAFKPKIQAALSKTGTTTLWTQIMNTYNKIPFVQKINPDLAGYVTQKGLDGIFYMISLEEAKIRKDPKAQTTQILQTVFGSLLGK